MLGGRKHFVGQSYVEVERINEGGIACKPRLFGKHTFAKNFLRL
jgi:hypothetical protein